MATRTFSLDEAAQQIPCKPRWLADGIREGRFTARRIGREVRMTEADITAAIEACRIDGTAQDSAVANEPPRSIMTARTARRMKGRRG
jgi:hypothetical protein